MRIALCTDFFYPELGGVQDSVALLAKTLGARGHQVMIYAPRAAARDYAVANSPNKELDLGSNVKICRLFSVSVPSDTGQSRFVVPTFTRWREFRVFQPDVIHTNTFFGIGLEAMWARKKLKVPLVGTNHFAVGEYAVAISKRLNPKIFSKWALKAVVWYYNHCDFLSAPSRSVIEEMQSWGLRIRSDVVSNPIDTEVFHPPDGEKDILKKKLGFSGSTFIYAGKFSPEKYVDVLVRALPMVAREVPDVQFMLAGHGSEKAHLENIARELGVSKHLRFMGTLSKPDLAEAYRAADIFSSASTSETQSLVLLQAYACGLPAVAVRWRAFKEYVPADCGFLAEPYKSDDIASKLVRLLRDRSLREQMGTRARDFALAFSADSVAVRWETIYRSASEEVKRA